MDETLSFLASQQHGVVTRAQALAAGLNDDEIARRLANGQWVTVRRGAYSDRRSWAAKDDLERHRALCHAVVLQLAKPVVICHVSAAVVAGLRVWDVDLNRVHVWRSDLRSPRIEGGVHHHTGSLAEADVMEVDGIPVTGYARTAIDVARTEGFESAVVTADDALAHLGTKNEPLLTVLDTMRDWRGARAAGRVVEFADARSESVGESRHRVQLERIGLPRPELQVRMPGPDGSADRVDFYFADQATVGEFDGRMKYEVLLRPGETAQDAIWREKTREDRLRERGLQVVRTVWADLYRDEAVAGRYLEAFARNRRPVVVA
ncbi:type IV toxin-antitoxin system AbiEi family antitoxin domain-containing protein [Jiangella mangrovi]|uniref:AbiEi antitoxin N-terminal domain-containing protein n=1 Tax=Jiangella mangrovi TaxID=1524084 RepID=A0A7W9GSX7_9ACTN|nr:type IV toxin-antitoxin system AbiEi family antitoxin domain-containing protein [Jiangella mangrovi]MBB5789218.1 hypothetical protein [Jiangella mangrovi]